MSMPESEHDTWWYSDPEQPWGGIRPARDLDDYEEPTHDEYLTPPTWKESSVRMCLDCGVTARIRDGKHDGCKGYGGPKDYLK